MSTTNPVFQVLVTSGNQAPLAINNPISALLPNQVGVFNYHSGLSVTAASPAADKQEIFIAVGVNLTGGATLEDINKSAGQLIQSQLVSGYTNRCFTAPAPMIVDITNYKVSAELEYAVKIEFRNQNIYSQYGYNQFTKTWSELGGCPTGDGTCADCGTNGDCNVFTTKMIDQINADPDKLVLAEYLDYTTDPGTPVVVAPEDVAAWVEDPANAGLCLGIRLTSIPESIHNYCDINLTYYNPRGTFLIVSLIEGFNCNGLLTTVQELTYGEGLGYDVKQLEYTAGGWNGRPGPYRVSTLTGTARTGFVYFTNVATNYSLLTITNDVRSQSNFEKYDNNTSTIIAIPCGDAATRNGLIAILDSCFPQFTANAGNSALCDCVGDETTNEYAVANNGIKILA